MNESTTVLGCCGSLHLLTDPDSHLLPVNPDTIIHICLMFLKCPLVDMLSKQIRPPSLYALSTFYPVISALRPPVASRPSKYSIGGHNEIENK